MDFDPDMSEINNTKNLALGFAIAIALTIVLSIIANLF